MKFLLVLFLIILDCVRSQYSNLNDNSASSLNLNNTFLNNIFGTSSENSNLNNKLASSSNLSNSNLIDIFGPPTPNTDGSASNPFGNPIPGTGTQNCRCVERQLCNDGSINSNGYGNLDIRGPSCSSPSEKCCEEKDIITPTKPTIQPGRGCGNRNQEGIGHRISDGENNQVQFAEFPWMVAILSEETIDERHEKLLIYKCGASIIHPEVVLTSAHCVDTLNATTLLIRGGEWDTKFKRELYPHQDRAVKKIIIHPNFYKRGLHNDVALIYLESPFNITKNVEPICLPSQDEVLGDLRCIATGWGKNSFERNSTYQDILKMVELPIIQRDICQERLRTSRVGMFFILDKSLICAGGEMGVDTCTGDGGSPLVCPIPGKRGRYQQRGLVAWGIGCGDMYPGAYGNVAHFRNWIDNEMLKLDLDTSTYII